jgi:hypothetical protein
MDDAVIRKRLATGESNTAPLGPRKLCGELLSLACSGVEPSKVERFGATLAQYAFTVERLRSVEARCAEELRYYAEREESSMSALAEATAEVARLRLALERERALREHKREYEAIAARLSELPSRDSYAAVLAGVESECAIALAERSALEARLAGKRSQFQLLLSALHDLGEAGREEAAAAAAAAARAAEVEAMEAELARTQAAAAAGAAGGAKQEDKDKGGGGGGEEEGEEEKKGRGVGGGEEPPVEAEAPAVETEEEEGGGGGGGGGGGEEGEEEGAAAEEGAAEGAAADGAQEPTGETEDSLGLGGPLEAQREGEEGLAAGGEEEGMQQQQPPLAAPQQADAEEGQQQEGDGGMED